MAKKNDKKTANKAAKVRAVPRRRTRMLALEPRMLFDGALALDLANAAEAAPAAEAHADVASAHATADAATAEAVAAVATHSEADLKLVAGDKDASATEVSRAIVAPG